MKYLVLTAVIVISFSSVNANAGSRSEDKRMRSFLVGNTSAIVPEADGIRILLDGALSFQDQPKMTGSFLIKPGEKIFGSTPDHSFVIYELKEIKRRSAIFRYDLGDRRHKLPILGEIEIPFKSGK